MNNDRVTGENKNLIHVHGEFAEAWKFQTVMQHWVSWHSGQRRTGWEGPWISEVRMCHLQGVEQERNTQERKMLAEPLDGNQGV